jgi:hypothetical protein
MKQHEADRIAAAMNQARPDWPLKQLATLLADSRITDRPRRDVFVALAWVASEPNSASPYRVLEAGPWWKAAGIEGSATKRDEPDPIDRCSVCALHRDRCRSLWNDHEFTPSHRRPEVDAHELVHRVRQEAACHASEPPAEVEHEPSPDVERLRHLKATATEPDPTAEPNREDATT